MQTVVKSFKASVYPSHILLQALNPDFGTLTELSIERTGPKVPIMAQPKKKEQKPQLPSLSSPPQQSQQPSSPQPKPPEFCSQAFQFDLLLGIISVVDNRFCALVTASECIGLLVKVPVYRVTAVKFIPLQAGFSNSSNPLYSQTLKILQNLNDEVIANNFYYSYFTNITTSRQNQWKNHNKFESIFYWNQKILQSISALKPAWYWTVPVIQGHISIASLGTSTYTLISRRSKMRPGPRYVCRGADKDGHSANYVESEDIYEYGGLVVSYVQVRASVPIEWKQAPFTGEVQLLISDEENMRIMEKALHYFQRRYGSLQIIDILSRKRKVERQLSMDYQKILNMLDHTHTYYYRDVKQLIKASTKNRDQVQLMLDECSPKWVGTNNYFIINQLNPHSQPLCLQKTFNRISCLDCLDRTNLLMCRISRRILSSTLQSHLLLADPSFQVSGRAQLHSKFHQAWMSNADHLSEIYCGTDSTITALTPSCCNKLSIGDRFRKMNTEMKRKYKGFMTDYQKDMGLRVLTGQGVVFDYQNRFDVTERMNQEPIDFQELQHRALHRGNIDKGRHVRIVRQ